MLCALASCAQAQAQVLGLTPHAAAERLKAGDIGFILEAELPTGAKAALSRLRTLTAAGPAAPFYAAFPVRAVEASRGSLLFALALEHPSPEIRQAAAGELILPVLETEGVDFVKEVLSLLGTAQGGEDEALGDLRLAYLRLACLYRLERFADMAKLSATTELPSAELSSGSPLTLLAALKAGKPGTEAEARSGLKAFCFNAADGALRSWALKEARRIDGGFFSPAETAALAGREAVTEYAYGRGVLAFREAARAEPELFSRYPELVAYLGRAYQYTTDAREEGALLLAEWSLSSGLGRSELPGGNYRRFRYLSLYYAGRIERQREQYDASTRWFTQALEAAPDALQSDACIWYISANALDARPETAAAVITAFIPRWSAPAYFADVMDRLSRYLIIGRQWRTVLDVFDRVEGRTDCGPITARYAWILGRATEEGYIGTFSGRRAEDFFQAAFEEEAAPMYYRAMSASKLGASFPAAPPPSPLPAGISSEAAFILGFFDNGAAAYSLPFIDRLVQRQTELPAADLRLLAAALAEAGLYAESITLAARLPLPTTAPEDRELLYPRPFRSLIEMYAGETGLAPDLLFALVRTESYFTADAVSSAGAVGLTQLMEATALDMAGRLARRGGPDYRATAGIDLTDPETNLHLGAVYLSYLMDVMGSPLAAILAYNGGMGRVRRWLAADPALPLDLFLETVEYEETREYARRVLSAATFYRFH